MGEEGDVSSEKNGGVETTRGLHRNGRIHLRLKLRNRLPRRVPRQKTGQTCDRKPEADWPTPRRRSLLRLSEILAR